MQIISKEGENAVVSVSIFPDKFYVIWRYLTHLIFDPLFLTTTCICGHGDELLVRHHSPHDDHEQFPDMVVSWVWHTAGIGSYPAARVRCAGMYTATARYTRATQLSTAVSWHTQIPAQIRRSCSGTIRWFRNLRPILTTLLPLLTFYHSVNK